MAAPRNRPIGFNSQRSQVEEAESEDAQENVSFDVQNVYVDFEGLAIRAAGWVLRTVVGCLIFLIIVLTLHYGTWFNAIPEGKLEALGFAFVAVKNEAPGPLSGAAITWLLANRQLFRSNQKTTIPESQQSGDTASES